MALFDLKRQRQKLSLANWLVEDLPQRFDRALEKLEIRHLKWLILPLLLFSVPLITTPLEVWQQGVVTVILIAIGQIIVRAEQNNPSKSRSEYLHLFMVWLSLVTTLRYLYYRTSYTLNFNNWINGISCVLLYGAELYAVLTLVLAYFQTLKIKDRQPVDLKTIPQPQWFTIDIYIPTYNESVDIVRKTALGALATDYPADKKRVYILDDGRKFPERREELRQMCDEIGCTLLTRENNDHAKAGNINTAFRHTQGDLVLILDCDHVPARDILQKTIGFFYNPKVSLVQTPHWFYNPDPFERNLLTGGKVPVGNELFYKVLQKGNDFWNAAFFCGSAAVIRKEHVMQIGGIAVETVTEDCHTSLRLHSLGYETVYYDKIMVAGLAPEKLVAYVGQQVRWARGMAQILRLENPMFNPKLKLTLPQRICYFSATSHFFYGFPRLMYAIAPTLFLLFSINPIRGLGLETLAYALPHILLGLNTNHLTYKHVRFSFWNEIFEFVMSYQAGIVTFLALINPKLGSFNVTDKGQTVDKRTFDWQSIRPLLIVTALVVTSLLAVPFWLLLRPEDSEAVLVNALWCVFNLILLVAACLVAFEQPQLRSAHRLQRHLGAVIYSADQSVPGITVNISETGALIALDSWANLPDEVEVEIIGDYGARAFLNGKIVRWTPVDDTQIHVVVDFINPTRAQLDNLVLVIYSDVKEWYGQKREIVDRPFNSFKFLATSLIRSFRDFKPERSVQKVRKQVQTTAQIYWEGQFYTGEATELGTSSLKLELDYNSASSEKQLQQQDIEKMRQQQPLVGLLLEGDNSANRFLAQITHVEICGNSDRSSVVIELRFPEQFKQKQAEKIKELLQTL
ncbi:glycosyltransferase [Gloeocapsopsis dulcis]|uniref:cellulose synthase (UDP-forming) n=1 Tax=Gloeocapsopsis dulcis AAB1 = 1H9 TaxID=1433147 RepID=A0A6N8FSE9_9CHRO|nr:glycosyltransferase [Gloeocapsopsis dulcis]MUL35769.1 cellulose synthase [Gloeocapsopsis dulcis AAB1 = 1H9]WNN90947.1 glycosyltransferase [Gloeocapsopsis dulcis]